MEVCTHTDIIVERLRRKPLFSNEAVSEQLNEYDTFDLTVTVSNSAITEVE